VVAKEVSHRCEGEAGRLLIDFATKAGIARWRLRSRSGSAQKE